MQDNESASESLPTKEGAEEIAGEEMGKELAEELAENTPVPSRLLIYLRLCRIPNVFTAFADVAMGFLFVNRGLEHWQSLLALLAASGCLYSAGMVLNDVNDVEVDREQRPERPIPAGHISLEQARAFGFGMLVTGVLCALVAGWLGPWPIAYRSGAIGICLAAAIVLYDLVLKSTILAPWMMGMCRSLNVLLGMSLAPESDVSMATFGYQPHELITAAGMGLYIVGVTWFARTEAKVSSRLMLGFGATLMVGGLGLLTMVPDMAPDAIKFRLTSTVWWLVVVVLMIAPLRRCVLAISNPEPQRVQAAIKQCILSLIVLNAALVLLTNTIPYSLAVCALLAPTLFLGRWVYST